jgi:hypothetical protein
MVLKFLEYNESHREERCILAGIAFAGPFICVNTRLLKSFLGRCKSSINGGFQQMGYVAIKTKTKARACIVAVLRSLTNDPSLLRQWTVRGASPSAEACFVSSFPVHLLPDVSNADLNLDHPTASPRPLYQPPKAVESPASRPVVQCLPGACAIQCFSAFDDSDWSIPAQQGIELSSDLAWDINPYAFATTMSVDVDADWVRITNEGSTL